MERLPHPSLVIDRQHRTTLSTSPSTVVAGSSNASSSFGDETEDVLSLRLLMRSIKASAPIVKINPNQCKILAKRLSQIFDTLMRMPNKTPTPQLLSTFRAADFMIHRMKAGGEWQSVLQQLFTCSAHFECLRLRIRQVWSLHSTASWEAEDRSANHKDEEHNVEMILLHTGPAVEHLPIEVLTAAQRRFLEEYISTLPALLQQADGLTTLTEDSSSFTARGDSSSFHVDPTASFTLMPLADDDCSSQDDVITLKAIKASILHFYRKRYSSRWKISAEEIAIKRVTHPNNTSTTEVPSAGDIMVEPVVVSVRNIDDANTDDDTYAVGTAEGFSANASYCSSSNEVPIDLPLPCSNTLFPCPPPPMTTTAKQAPVQLHAPPAAQAHGPSAFVPRRCNLTAHPSRIFSFVPPSEAEPLEEAPMQTSHSPFSLTAPSEFEMSAKAASSGSVGSVGERESVELAARFKIDDGSVLTLEGGSSTTKTYYVFRNQKVIIKRLRDTALLTPETLEMFVVDVACRVRWCHPNLVTCHGAFCEEFKGDSSCKSVEPFLSLGLVMSDLCDECSAASASTSLQQLLFLEGKKFSLADAIRVVLQVADALQFCLFDSDDVPCDVLERWRWISPSNIFVWDSRNAAMVREDATTVGIGRYVVQYSPPMTIANGPVSRWAPHPMASNPECYALTQLLISLLTNQQPFHGVTSQTHLQALRQRQKRVGAADSAAHVMGMTVPKYLPEQIQTLCAIGLRLKQAPPDVPSPPVERSSSFISRFMKAHAQQPPPQQQQPSSQAKPYSLLLFRKALNDLLPMADSLPKIDDINADQRITSFVCETAVDDYGWVEPAKVFDRHDV